MDTAFDTLFARRTGYGHFDERIAATAAKKEALLCVLAHPTVPLHHNPAEGGARHRVRTRDVSFGPRAPAGLHAWDVFGTLTQTAAKLGVHSAHYVYDRLSGASRLPSLAALILQQAACPPVPRAAAASSPTFRRDTFIRVPVAYPLIGPVIWGQGFPVRLRRLGRSALSTGGTGPVCSHGDPQTIADCARVSVEDRNAVEGATSNLHDAYSFDQDVDRTDSINRLEVVPSQDGMR